jgi:hypothetical protein
MEMVLTTLSAWSASATAWLQASTGFTIKDLALLVGGILIVIALLWLGLYSGKPRYREAARFGWFLFFFAAAVIGWGLYDHNMRADWNPRTAHP